MITFHGPGQLVVYPIINLKHFKPSVRWYVAQIENTVIQVCAKFGLKAETSPHTGVWIDDKKVKNNVLFSNHNMIISRCALLASMAAVLLQRMD